MEILQKINDLHYWDWEFYKYDGCNLTIAAGLNLYYGHSLEIYFFDVAYVNCPTYFCHASFRMASKSEIELLTKIVDLEDLRIFVIEAETDRIDLGVFFIVARSIKMKQGNFTRQASRNS